MKLFKKSIFSLCASALILFNFFVSIYAYRLPEIAVVSRQAAAEGIVLLENPNMTKNKCILPFDNNETVSVFGRTQLDYLKCGNGSGGMVTSEYVVNIIDGLRNNKNIKINEDLYKIYSNWVKENPVSKKPWSFWDQSAKEMPLDEKTVSAAAGKSDAAIIVIGRNSGEDQDLKNEKGSYLLQDSEIDMIYRVCMNFDRVAIVLNTCSPIDLSWIKDYCPNVAVMLAWQGGDESGNAIADILTGEVNPSGRLVDTIAKSITDYPSEGEFCGKKLSGEYIYGASLQFFGLGPWFSDYCKNFYCEDIYVGYRYFETFAKDKVLYPFGYGLSYTDFEIKTNKVAFEDEEDISLDITVTNTGEKSGKEVVQMYCSAPQGRLGKPAKSLVAFAKTEELSPNESQNLKLSFNLSDMVSYDETGATGHKSAYIMESGNYEVFTGKNVRNCEEVFNFNIDSNYSVEQLEQNLIPVDNFKRVKTDKLNEKTGNYEIASEDVPYKNQPELEKELIQKIENNRAKEMPYTGYKGYKLADAKSGKVTLDEFIAQFTKEELAALTLGEGMDNPKVTRGTAAAFGGVIKALAKKFGLPVVCCDDGPSGIRIESGDKEYRTTSCLPNMTALACTWNKSLLEKLGESLGKEMLKNKIDIILAPGANIHRHPFCGRNFEYFSECPILTGKSAAAFIKGIQKSGVSACIKHLACNEQELSRHFVSATVSERALRETYLKPFEIAVKEGNVHCIMTSYNPINGVWAAGNYDLINVILRKEWGFDGIVMTDWWARINDSTKIYSKSDKTSTDLMIRAGGDLYMVENNGKSDSSTRFRNNLKNANLADLQACAKRICGFLMLKLKN